MDERRSAFAACAWRRLGPFDERGRDGAQAVGEGLEDAGTSDGGRVPERRGVILAELRAEIGCSSVQWPRA